ncbi:DUF6232 family protein [Solwaraspora sp. WMMB335]|uniref:DUF6232 family protein n=1 Tax=Solwaraspora sp. WMMB335 TaxID=3404118 RepID=UPI003B964FA7
MRATRQTPSLRGSPPMRDASRPRGWNPPPATVPATPSTYPAPATRNSRAATYGQQPVAGAASVGRGNGGSDGLPAYYRQPGIRVTRDWFVVAGQRYAIRDIAQLRIARGARDRITARAVALVAVMLAGIALVIGFTRGLDEVSAGAYLALFVAAFVPVGLAWLGDRLRPRPYELWGRHQQTWKLLFSSDEERQFGQVRRAVMRAQEASRLARAKDPVITIEPWLPGRP